MSPQQTKPKPAEKPPERTDDEREAATHAFVEVALDDAYRLREEYSSFVARRRANREQLRSLEAQGKLSKEEAEELAELYPARSTKDQEAEEASVAA